MTITEARGAVFLFALPPAYSNAERSLAMKRKHKRGKRKHKR